MKAQNQPQPDKEEMEKLLAIHSQKIGLDPQKVKRQLEKELFSGNFAAMQVGGGIKLDEASLQALFSSTEVQTQLQKMINEQNNREQE